jgi:hypothetical protein
METDASGGGSSGCNAASVGPTDSSTCASHSADTPGTQGSAEPADTQTALRNAEWRAVVEARLREQLPAPARGQGRGIGGGGGGGGGTALGTALAELASLAAACDSANVEFAAFSALDELMAGLESDADLGPVVSCPDADSAAGGVGAACTLLTLVGRYCQLWGFTRLALGHFNAAAEVPNGAPNPAYTHRSCAAEASCSVSYIWQTSDMTGPGFQRRQRRQLGHGPTRSDARGSGRGSGTPQPPVSTGGAPSPPPRRRTFTRRAATYGMLGSPAAQVPD